VQQGSTGVPAPRGRAQTAAVTAAPAELQKPGLPPSGKKAAGRSATSSHPSSRKDTSNGSSAAAHTYSSYSKWDKMDVDAMLASSGSEDEAAPAPRRPEAVSASTAQEIVHPMQAPGHNAAAPVVAAPRQPLPADELLRPVATTPTAPDVAKTEPEPVSNGQQASSKQPSQQQQRGDPPPVRNSEPQTADAWRTRGNELFKAGQWAFAKQCYGRSLTLDPSNVAALANRAMAELKLQEWAEAEEDCTAALQLDPVHVKVCMHAHISMHCRLSGTACTATQPGRDMTP
jgi:Meckel syndrome type 1 protein